MTRFASWLGLTRASGQQNTIPSWQGVPRRTKLLCAIAWILVSITLFTILNWLIPTNDGLSGAAPILISILIGSLALTWAQRRLIKATSRTPQNTPN